MVDLSFSLYELEYFLLIVVRITAFIFVAPFFSMPNTPRRVRIALGIFIAVMVYNIMEPVPVEYSSVLGYAIIVIKEAMVGLIIGYGAAICVSILNFAGHTIDTEIGLSMVSIFDPVSKEQTTITGTYYNYTVMLLLLISGLYQYILSAIVYSFTVIPINGAVFSSEKLLTSMVTFLGDYLSIGFRIVLPVFAAIMLLNTILGILAKISPQLNMFAVGIQLKILVGLSIMFFTVSLLPGVSSFVTAEVKKMITLFTEAMV